MRACVLRVPPRSRYLLGTETARPETASMERYSSGCACGGVTPTELRWYHTIHTKEGTQREVYVTGHEFLGENCEGW